MTPSWPVLAGWLRTPTATSATGRWRTPEGEGTFAWRAPDEWTGMRAWGGEVGERGDFTRPLGPVTGVVHDGRPCWRVDLEAPAHKVGVLTKVVDDETGLLLSRSNSQTGLILEVVDLVVDPQLDAALFAPPRDVDRELRELCDERPPPTPLWFPARRCHVQEDDLVELGSGAVGRAPLGEPAPSTPWRQHVVRLEHGGWSWAVSSDLPMDEATARWVVAQTGP